MKKQIIIWAMVILGGGQLTAQFHSNYQQQQLFYGDLMNDDSWSDATSPQFTVVLPSFSVSFISPGFQYGDMYVEDRKALDLSLARDTGKDFGVLLNTRMSYGGFKYNTCNMSFSFFHEWTGDVNMNLPHELFYAATEGNTSLVNSTLPVNPYAFVQSAHKWSLGWGMHGDNYAFDAQLHLVLGDAHLNTKNSNIDIIVQDDFFELAFDKSIDAVSSGVIDYHKIDSISLIANDHALSGMGSFSNIGVGASFQFQYQPGEALKLFARVDDIGMIKWNNEAYTYTDDGYSSFEGFDVRDAHVNGTEYSLEDTVYALINVVERNEGFSSTMLYSTMIGARYDMNDWISIGGNIRTKATGRNQMLFAEAQAIFTPLKNTSFSISNIYFKDAPLNVRLGVHTEISQMVGIYCDVINPWAMPKYYDAQMLYASFGTYLNFGEMCN